MSDQDFLTVDEAAVLLRINRNTLYESIKLGQVPGVLRIGRLLRIRRADLLGSALTPAGPKGTLPAGHHDSPLKDFK